MLNGYSPTKYTGVHYTMNMHKKEVPQHVQMSLENGS